MPLELSDRPLLRRRPRAAAIGVVLALGALGPAASAGEAATTTKQAAARPSMKKAIWGPATPAAFAEYQDLGAGIYQYPLRWSSVATARPADPTNPNDPAYRWPADLDFAYQQASRQGMQVLIRASRTPAWANGGQSTAVPPTSSRDYADFLEAAAKRYPAVKRWMIWEEPIRLVNWLPHPQQAVGISSNAKPLTSAQKRDVHRYAQLLDAAYVRLKAVRRSNLVIGGNTTTSGDVMGPEQFIKNLRLPNGKRPRMDLYGHNPFSSRAPDLSDGPLAKGTADFSDLDTLEGWLDRYVGRRSNGQRLRVFISEYTAPTDEAPSFQFPFTVTRGTQASWLTKALRITRRSSNRIATLGWYQLDDIPATPGMDGSNVGLVDAAGAKKPAYYAYQRG